MYQYFPDKVFTYFYFKIRRENEKTKASFKGCTNVTYFVYWSNKYLLRKTTEVYAV